MKLGSAALALALAAQDSAPPAEPDWVADLPPRKPIAGLAGFHSTSRIVYAEAPDLPHVLETTYVFPDRVRWYLAIADGELGDRSTFYRCGSVFFSLGENATDSVVLAPKENESEFQTWRVDAKQRYGEYELRRALFLWPDGFDWRRTNDPRRGPSSAATGIESGVIEADLGPHGRPDSMTMRGPVFDVAYRDITWRLNRDRWWPASMAVYLHVVGDSRTTADAWESVWTETVDSVETSIHVHDDYFVPHDRRRRDSPLAGARGDVVPIEIPAELASRSELAADTDWPAALARAKSWRTNARERAVKAKREVEAASLIEVDASGKPLAVLARLVGGDGALPEGFASTPARRALSRWVPFDASAIGAALAELRARLPLGSRAGIGYVRITAPDSPDPLAQVVLSYEERR